METKTNDRLSADYHISIANPWGDSRPVVELRQRHPNIAVRLSGKDLERLGELREACLGIRCRLSLSVGTIPDAWSTGGAVRVGEPTEGLDATQLVERLWPMQPPARGGYKGHGWDGAVWEFSSYPLGD